jgi:hypothetical protein
MYTVFLQRMQLQQDCGSRAADILQYGTTIKEDSSRRAAASASEGAAEGACNSQHGQNKAVSHQRYHHHQITKLSHSNNAISDMFNRQTVCQPEGGCGLE